MTQRFPRSLREAFPADRFAALEIPAPAPRRRTATVLAVVLALVCAFAAGRAAAQPTTKPCPCGPAAVAVSKDAPPSSSDRRALVALAIGVTVGTVLGVRLVATPTGVAVTGEF